MYDNNNKNNNNKTQGSMDGGDNHPFVKIVMIIIVTIIHNISTPLSFNSVPHINER